MLSVECVYLCMQRCVSVAIDSENFAHWRATGPGRARRIFIYCRDTTLSTGCCWSVLCVCVYVSTLTPQHHAYVFITVKDQRSCSSLTVCRCVVYAVQRKRGARTVCWDMRHEYLWARCQKLFLPLCRLLIPAIYYTHYVSVIWMNDVREFHIRRRSMRRHARANGFFLYVFETVEIWRYWLFMGDKCDAIWLLLRCVCSPLQYSNEYNKREMDG